MYIYIHTQYILRMVEATFTQDRVLPICLIFVKCIRSLALIYSPRPDSIMPNIDHPHPILGNAYLDTHLCTHM